MQSFWGQTLCIIGDVEVANIEVLRLSQLDAHLFLDRQELLACYINAPMRTSSVAK